MSDQKQNSRETILSRLAVEVARHPKDPRKDKLTVVQSFEWIEGNKGHPVIFELEGHDLSSPIKKILEDICEAYNDQIRGHAYWSIGKTPEEAIEALAKHRGFGPVTSTSEYDELNTDSKFDWGRRFTAEGTYFKCAGINVPGGCILTWWK